MPLSARFGFRARPLATVLFGIGLAAGGCNPPSKTDAPSDEVRGTALITLMSREAGVPPRVQAWDGRLIWARVPSASGTDNRVGIVDGDGTFRIVGVPPGPYWLSFADAVTSLNQQAHVYVWTEARELDLGSQHQDAILLPGDESLPLGALVTGLSPVEADDQLHLTPSSGAWSLHLGPRPLGAEQVVVNPPPQFNRVRPRERVTAQQWRRSKQGGRTTDVIVRAGEGVVPAEVGMPLYVTLTEPPARQLDLRVDHAGFLRQLGLVIPGTPTRQSSDFMLIADADPTGATLDGQEAAVRLSVPDAPAQPNDPSASGLRYGDPYPEGWARRYELHYGAAFPCGGAAAASGCFTDLRVRGLLSELTAGTVQPRLSSPQSLTLDGQDAMTTAQTISASPTVRWQAPAHGQAAVYILSVLRLVAKPDGSTSEEDAGRFITKRTELTVLPEVLKPGERYAFELRALGGLALDATVAPRRVLHRPAPAESRLRSAPFTVAAAP